MSDYQHIWTISIANICAPDRPREVNYVAPAAFDKAVVAGRELIAKKWPNPYKDKWPEDPWHPDWEIVGIKRGMELDNETEEPT